MEVSNPSLETSSFNEEKAIVPYIPYRPLSLTLKGPFEARRAQVLGKPSKKDITQFTWPSGAVAAKRYIESQQRKKPADYSLTLGNSYQTNTFGFNFGGFGIQPAQIGLLRFLDAIFNDEKKENKKDTSQGQETDPFSFEEGGLSLVEQAVFDPETTTLNMQVINEPTDSVD